MNFEDAIDVLKNEIQDWEKTKKVLKNIPENVKQIDAIISELQQAISILKKVGEDK